MKVESGLVEKRVVWVDKRVEKWKNIVSILRVNPIIVELWTPKLGTFWKDKVDKHLNFRYKTQDKSHKKYIMKYFITHPIILSRNLYTQFYVIDKFVLFSSSVFIFFVGFR